MYQPALNDKVALPGKSSDVGDDDDEEVVDDEDDDDDDPVSVANNNTGSMAGLSAQGRSTRRPSKG